MDQLPATPDPGEQLAATGIADGDTPASGAGAATPTKKGGGFLRALFEIVETLVLTLVIFFVIQNFVAQPFEVHQFSMEHTFEPKDYVLVDKLSPRWSTYQRGDVVVFTPPEGWDQEKTPFIKRVIAVAGETVELRDGQVFVNGTQLDEPYLFAGDDGIRQPTEALSESTSWTVEPGYVFVMGDHRQQSQDSRAFGPIKVDSVIGRGFVRYWPISKLTLITRPEYSGIAAP